MDSLSVMGYEARKNPFRSLIPDISFIHFNREEDLEHITKKTAAVILDTIQGDAGCILPKTNYLAKVRKCRDEMGTLLIVSPLL